MDTPVPPSVSDEVRSAVESVLDALLLPGELDRWTVAWHEEPAETWALVVDVQARGESHRGLLCEWGAGYPIEDGLDVFTDGFEDFISESRFAWGQQRELRPRPWRG